MDPDETELQGFTNLASVMDWAGVVDIPESSMGSNDGIPLRSSVLLVFGNPTLIRELALIPREVWYQSMGAILVAGFPPNPTQLARIGSLRRFIRLRCGLPPTEPEAFTITSQATSSTALVPPHTACICSDPLRAHRESWRLS